MTFQHLMRLCVVFVCVCGTSASATAQTVPAACQIHPFAIVDLGAAATGFGVAGWVVAPALEIARH